MSDTAALTDQDGTKTFISAEDGNVWISLFRSDKRMHAVLSIDEADEIVAGICKAQLVAAEQRGAQASADLALASLRGRDRYQPKHLGL